MDEKLWGDALKIVDMEGKWDRVEESNKPKLVNGVQQLGNNLYELGRFMEELKPLKRHLRAGKKAVAYLMGHTSGLGFSAVLWGQGRLYSESGEFCTLY